MQPTSYAIVTGGGSGIGRAICLALARRGWSVAIVDNRGESASAVVDEIAQISGNATAHEFDVSDAVAWEQFACSLKRSWPQLDLLVNNAGNLLTGEIDACVPDDLRRIVEVNLLGAMYGCQVMIPWMKETRSTVHPCGVINIASIFAAVAPPRFSAYNASKAGVVALTESLRGELAPHNLNATVVLPGITPTKLFDRAKYSDVQQEELCRRFVGEAVLTPDNVADETLAGASNGNLYVVVGRRSRWYGRLKRLAPQWLIDRVGRMAAREFAQVAPTVSATCKSDSPGMEEVVETDLCST